MFTIYVVILFLGICCSLEGMKQKQIKVSEVCFRCNLPKILHSSILLNHICKKQSKDPFYREFILRSIITVFALFWVWQGGGMAPLIGQDNTLFLYVR